MYNMVKTNWYIFSNYYWTDTWQHGIYLFDINKKQNVNDLILIHNLCLPSNRSYSAAQIYPNYTYAYYTRVFCIYVYVYTHIRVCQYARICPFVMHSHKFLYMKHCWANKGHVGMKRLQSEICLLLKCHADQWKLSHFKFSITSQIHRPFLWLLLDLKLPNMGRKLKQSLETPV